MAPPSQTAHLETSIEERAGAGALTPHSPVSVKEHKQRRNVCEGGQRERERGGEKERQKEKRDRDRFYCGSNVTWVEKVRHPVVFGSLVLSQAVLCFLEASGPCSGTVHDVSNEISI